MNKITWTDWRGNLQERTINTTIDVEKFRGTPGYSLLVVAANTHLSIADIKFYLSCVAHKHDMPEVERSKSWIQRRRWLFQRPGTNNAKGAYPNIDGKEARAIQIMQMYPKASLRDLVKLLKGNGIKRSYEWVRRHRCV